MKVFVYGYREEEAAYFSACAKAMQLEIGTCAQRPTLENAQLCQGYECISVLSTPIDAALLYDYAYSDGAAQNEVDFAERCQSGLFL